MHNFNAYNFIVTPNDISNLIWFNIQSVWNFPQLFKKYVFRCLLFFSPVLTSVIKGKRVVEFTQLALSSCAPPPVSLGLAGPCLTAITYLVIQAGSLSLPCSFVLSRFTLFYWLWNPLWSSTRAHCSKALSFLHTRLFPCQGSDVIWSCSSADMLHLTIVPGILQNEAETWKLLFSLLRLKTLGSSLILSCFYKLSTVAKSEIQWPLTLATSTMVWVRGWSVPSPDLFTYSLTLAPGTFVQKPRGSFQL